MELKLDSITYELISTQITEPTTEQWSYYTHQYHQHAYVAELNIEGTTTARR